MSKHIMLDDVLMGEAQNGFVREETVGTPNIFLRSH